MHDAGKLHAMRKLCAGRMGAERTSPVRMSWKWGGRAEKAKEPTQSELSGLIANRQNVGKSATCILPCFLPLFDSLSFVWCLRLGETECECESIHINGLKYNLIFFFNFCFFFRASAALLPSRAASLLPQSRSQRVFARK